MFTKWKTLGSLLESNENHIPSTFRKKNIYKLPSILSEIQATLKSAYTYFTGNTDITIDASEWLQDNYYIVRRALRQVREDLPYSFYLELPVLEMSCLPDRSRVFSICSEFTENCGGQLDILKLISFLEEYQQKISLTTGEIWAVPPMLRLCTLLELTKRLQSILENKLSDQDISFCILSLRMLDEVDWNHFFEEVSLVEKILRRDPADIYSKMDFTTRNMYRNRVEETARCIGIPESEVASLTVKLANNDFDHQDALHIGFYLLSATGIKILRKKAGCTQKRFAISPKWKLTCYLGGIFLTTFFILILFEWYALNNGAGLPMLLILFLLSVLPASAVGVDVVNEFIAHIKKPCKLPRMDFSRGIPIEYKTIVVIPTLFGKRNEAISLVNNLEQHYLANPDKNLYFALLSDFMDAPMEVMTGDDELLDCARVEIKELNRKYNCGSEPRFHVFHRKRLWNPVQGCWMGWERKRGKLMEFNKMLLKKGNTSFISGRIPADIKYVITLDSDTVLPGGTAARLVATMAHPLNNFGKEHGYSVLQPRVLPECTEANLSIFATVYPGDFTVDLYSNAVSNVYQDIFGEGSYVGKGIYDPAAFESCMSGKVPENSLLSHDLFEGIQGRAGLVSDVVLYENFPPNYIAWSRRLHRWIRGDWQLLAWLKRDVPTEVGTTSRNRLKFLDQWKVLDNLRRSLAEPALLLLLVSGWVFLPGSPVFWTMIFLAVYFRSSIFITIIKPLNIFQKSPDKHWLRTVFSIIFLPYETFIKLHAVTVTLFRLIVTHRNLLEWTTAAHTWKTFDNTTGRSFSWKHMYSVLIFTPALLALLLVSDSKGLLAAVPFIIVWLLSPEIENWISKTPPAEKAKLGEKDKELLRRIALKTWNYFDTFTGPEDHWLPPDHYQEDPLGRVAHRTSPTNIGLFLLSVLSAKDMGYISSQEFILRISDTLSGMSKLQKYRGHFLNWYDTRTLKPLFPMYVSTVDSGNLSGSLIALAQGFADIENSSFINRQRWLGFLDTVSIVLEILEVNDVHSGELKTKLNSIREEILCHMDKPESWIQLLSDLCETNLDILDAMLFDILVSNEETIPTDTITELQIWFGRMRTHLYEMLREVKEFYPWQFHIANPPSMFIPGESSENISDIWQEMLGLFPTCPSPYTVVDCAKKVTEQLMHLIGTLEDMSLSDKLSEAQLWCKKLEELIAESLQRSIEISDDMNSLKSQIRTLFRGTGYGFLYNSKRKVFHIGLNVETERLDSNYYDLLASEARLASLIAVAKGDVPNDHWVHLSRPLTVVSGMMGLLSWSGTMFEYLMPLLLTGYDKNTLIGQSCRTAVKHQINHCKKKSIPWGISESGYHEFDPGSHYQYKAFGVPGLGYKRGLEEDTVVTPYASILALSLLPHAVMKNIQKLTDSGMMGSYGFYESIDFTPGRLPAGRKNMIIRSYMAHHQGMIMLSVTNFLNNDTMVTRFFSEPAIKTVKLLLQERIPLNPPVIHSTPDLATEATVINEKIDMAPWSVSKELLFPRVNYLSNGSYGSAITNSGGGFSNWKGTSLTRWRGDSTLDCWGNWIYMKDITSGNLWSATALPVQSTDCDYRINFLPHSVEFMGRNKDFSWRMQIIVDPEKDTEIRRFEITNNSNTIKKLFLCSYSEVILTAQREDIRHPAFNKLFIVSEFSKKTELLMFHRRKRTPEEIDVFMGHMLLGAKHVICETDRMRFLGRGGATDNPEVLSRDTPEFNCMKGEIVDPIMSLGTYLDLPAHNSTVLHMITFCSEDADGINNLVDRYKSPGIMESIFSGIEMFSRRELVTHEMSCEDIQRAQQVLSSLFYPSILLRAKPEELEVNRLGQKSLWRFGISGDNPILLISVATEDNTELLKKMLKAHTFWRMRGLTIDLVIVNGEESGYEQQLQGKLNRLLITTGSGRWINSRGGVFLLRQDQLSEDETVLLKTWSNVVLNSNIPLDMQLQTKPVPARLPEFVPIRSSSSEQIAPLLRPENLLFDNGTGGFSPDGKEYIIYLNRKDCTPAPWINVISNPSMGFIASESGLGCSWALNSGENRLTPWNNDPVSDTPGEVVYLRDEESGEFWSPTPQPVRESSPYLIRHGAGYTSWEHNSHGLVQKMVAFVTPNDPLKVINIHLDNPGNCNRRMSITLYIEPVMGTERSFTQKFILSEFNAGANVLFARNSTDDKLPERTLFLASSRTPNGLTTDRTEFLGRTGSYKKPAAMERTGLSGTVFSGIDPCMAIQIIVWIGPGESKEATFILGEGASREEALELVDSNIIKARDGSLLNEVKSVWDKLLNVITVKTPDSGMNIMLNRWLLYQTLSCRIWGRTALYQSSGAYGFRDQLQDCMALCSAAPEILREHILKSASMQFTQGDVLHWWHPPETTGVRTRCSDDLLWLPYATSIYVEKTGDTSILYENIPFLVAEPLSEQENERYAEFAQSSKTATLYEHCILAIEKGNTKGIHGIPLIGSHDWNDGMSRVGIEGAGESIWLGWFTYDTLIRFSRICRSLNDTENDDKFVSCAKELKESLKKHAWDGDWYLRGFYDDGTQLGSSQSDECRIDSIAQSWAVLSGAGEPGKTEQAMDSLLGNLVNFDQRLVMLLTPPFDKTEKDPGYIMGYPPGVRENGGQYTHAAAWVAWAFADMGKGDIAESVFRLLNPIYHSDSAKKTDIYRVEPYVVAADVYSNPSCRGRGGWTWYTGAAGWLYRVGIEAILGITTEGDNLRINPCIPSKWTSYTAVFRRGKSTCNIIVNNPEGVSSGVISVTVNEKQVESGLIPLASENTDMTVTVIMGTKTSIDQS